MSTLTYVDGLYYVDDVELRLSPFHKKVMQLFREGQWVNHHDADRLWGEHPPTNPSSTLRVQINSLRALLVSHGVTSHTISTKRGSGYQLVENSPVMPDRDMEREVA